MSRLTLPAALSIIALLCACDRPAASAEPVSQSTKAAKTRNMTIVRIQSGSRQWTVRLDDTPAARDFAAMLPLKLGLTDYAATEKIADLPGKLRRDGAPASPTPRAGDLAYCAPWGNMVIYHKDFRASPGLIILGHLDGDIAAFAKAGPMQVTITRGDASTTERAR